MIEIRGVAGDTLRGRTCISIGMTLNTIRGQVCTGEWKVGVVVVKTIGRIACRVTSQTSRTVVRIAPDPVVLIVGLRIGMATGAGYLCVI